MFMECDEIAIESGLWARVLARDAAAVQQLREALSGMVLYVHALSLRDGVQYEHLTARQVCAALGDNMTLTVGFDGQEN